MARSARVTPRAAVRLMIITHRVNDHNELHFVLYHSSDGSHFVLHQPSQVRAVSDTSDDSVYYEQHPE